MLSAHGKGNANASRSDGRTNIVSKSIQYLRNIYA
jgi:hypothetical protein